MSTNRKAVHNGLGRGHRWAYCLRRFLTRTCSQCLRRLPESGWHAANGASAERSIEIQPVLSLFRSPPLRWQLKTNACVSVQHVQKTQRGVLACGINVIRERMQRVLRRSDRSSYSPPHPRYCLKDAKVPASEDRRDLSIRRAY